MNQLSRILILLILFSLPVLSLSSQSQKSSESSKRTILGYYTGESDNDELYKLSLYSDGYFLERVYSKTNQEWFTNPGTYAVSSDKSRIELNYLGYEESWNSTAEVTKRGDLKTEDLLYMKVKDSVSLIESEDEIVGSYLFEYYLDEDVIILLSFNRDGSFIEKQYYPETREVSEEYGHYEVSVPSGCFSLSYDQWKEGDCLGFLNAKKGLLYLPDGDYSKTVAKSDEEYLSQGF